ncbi:GM23146 [Drosophila sechellia]|uniref:Protein Turandot Z n=2 Tax=Drosophila sechellia TaxID=7238 RepID=TOTZ_DROSE|nr:RecName: Full=Protein Turandot Z; Flags: Precursor [Drosophila sechellia]EDW49599.1 GM23146 [Drosophila sechellia]
MYFAIRLSFVLAVLFCLTGNGSARMLDADRNRLQQLQIRSQQSTDANTQVDIAYEVIGIYDKYKGQGGSNVLREAQLNSQVNDFKRKTMVIDGVPAQGGVWGILGAIKKAADAVPDNVKKDAENLVKSSTKVLVRGIYDYLMGKMKQH